MATAHHFEGRLRWRAGGTGVEAGNHEMEFAGRPALSLRALRSTVAIPHACHRRTSSSGLSPPARC